MKQLVAADIGLLSVSSNSAYHLGPFACVFESKCTSPHVQTPTRVALVLPQDRILPFFGRRRTRALLAPAANYADW